MLETYQCRFIRRKKSKTAFLNTIISQVSFVIYQYNTTCRMKENFQSCKRLAQFLKKSLSKEMDLILNFSKQKYSSYSF